MNPLGYFSDREMTNFDIGFGECRAATNPNPTYGDGVVTPHAPFLAMMYEPVAAYDNLVRLENNLGAYGPGGFYDAVAVGSRTATGLRWRSATSVAASCPATIGRITSPSTWSCRGPYWPRCMPIARGRRPSGAC